MVRPNCSLISVFASLIVMRRNICGTHRVKQTKCRFAEFERLLHTVINKKASFGSVSKRINIKCITSLSKCRTVLKFGLNLSYCVCFSVVNSNFFWKIWNLFNQLILCELVLFVIELVIIDLETQSKPTLKLMLASQSLWISLYDAF